MSIRQRGKRSWEINVPLGADPVTGKRLRGFHSFKGTKREAEAEERRLLRERDLGTYVLPTRMTTAEYLTQWLGHIDNSNRRPRTKEGYRSIVEGHLLPALGPTPLAKLTSLHIENYYDKQRAGENAKERKLSDLTLLHHHQVLRAALNRAVKMRFIGVNPVMFVEAPEPDIRQPVVLDDAQAAVFLAALHDADTDLYIAALLAAGTGGRRGEILGVPWSKINLEKRRMAVEQTLQVLIGGRLLFQPPKTERSKRTIVMPKFLVAALQEHLKLQAERKLLWGAAYEDSGLVVCRPDGRPWTPSSFSTAFGAMAEKLGYENLRFHDLRHMHATQLLDDRVDIQRVSGRMGHSSTATTLRVYSHVLRDADQSSARSVEKRLGNELKKLG